MHLAVGKQYQYCRAMLENIPIDESVDRTVQPLITPWISRLYWLFEVMLPSFQLTTLKIKTVAEVFA